MGQNSSDIKSNKQSKEDILPNITIYMSSWSRKLFYSFPPSIRFMLRWLFFLPHDLISKVTSSHDLVKPPRRLIYTGGGDFLQTGEDFVEDFLKQEILFKNSSVLDVGSGIGRMAIPLTPHLTDGTYEGFDIMKVGVAWCRKNITGRYPNFNFTLADLSNDLYRNQGNDADMFRFPYSDEQFDLVIVISVFTHLIASELMNYTSEIHRVLKPGGKCYSTFFILNDTSRQAMVKGKNDFNFQIRKENYRLIDEQVRSANVAYEESFLRTRLFQPGQFLFKSIMHGNWSTGQSGRAIDFQDRVVVEKL